MARREIGHMGKHSPGPWTVDDWMIRSADRERILDATVDSFPGDLDLAAAAPELLDLVRDAAAVLDGNDVSRLIGKASILLARFPKEDP